MYPATKKDSVDGQVEEELLYDLVVGTRVGLVYETSTFYQGRIKTYS